MTGPPAQSVSYNYVSAATYWPDGAPMTMATGNGLSTTWYRNKRMQPKETVLVRNGNTQLIDRQYCYGASAVSGANCTSQSVGDNGNIFQIQDVLNGNNTQTFQYDNLNRLNSFTNGSGSMQQTYAIDPWGNMIQNGGTLSSGTNFLGSTKNRDTSGTTGYDNAGNITAYYNGLTTRHFAYDDEGQITNVDNGYATYTYNAPGNRVRKDSGGSWTEYIYFGSEVVAEKSGDGSWSDYIFANGTRLAKAGSVNALTPSSSTTYYHSDQIGSTRMQTDGAGNVVSTNDFYPYGQGPQATSQNHYLFSGKERDAESGLDCFGARYYLSGIGRFMSADWSAQADPVPYAKLDDPQTLNLYAYVRNNPISLVDPDGHYANPDPLGTLSPFYYNPVACQWNEQEMGKLAVAKEETRKQAQQQLSSHTLSALGLSTSLHVTAQEVVAGVLAQEFRGEGTDAAQAGAVIVLNRALQDLANDDKASQWGHGGVSQQGLSNADNAMLQIISAPNQFEALSKNPSHISSILAGKADSPEYGAALGKLRSVSIGASSLGNFGRVGNVDIGGRENFVANWSGRTRHDGILVNHTEFY